MPEATCTAAGLITAGTCFTGQNFDSKEQASIIAYLWWKWADSVTNTAYTWDSLVSASSCIAVGLTDDKKTAALIGILNRGTSGAGTIATNVEITALTASTAATAIACIQKSTMQQIEGATLFNICRFFGEFTS
jgi:hypothetical protein